MLSHTKIPLHCAGRLKRLITKKCSLGNPHWARAWLGADGRFVWYEASCSILAAFLCPLLSAMPFGDPYESGVNRHGVNENKTLL